MKDVLDKIYEGGMEVTKYKNEHQYSQIYNKNNLVYGEFSKYGIELIVKELKERGLFQEIHYLDIGSGNGRSVLHMGLYEDVITSNGVELYQSKVDYAISKITECNYPFNDKIYLTAGCWDVVKLKNLDKINLVMINNICTIDNPPKKILESLKKGTIVVSVFNILDYESMGFIKIKSIKSNYSWTRQHTIDTTTLKKI